MCPRNTKQSGSCSYEVAPEILIYPLLSKESQKIKRSVFSEVKYRMIHIELY